YPACRSGGRWAPTLRAYSEAGANVPRWNRATACRAGGLPPRRALPVRKGVPAGVHAGLIEQYWQNGFPPLKRLRGRRNALTWWLERAQTWLENNPPPPLEAANHTAMVDAATRIDQGLAENDPESPPLSTFVRQLKNLDVLPEVEDAAAADAGGAQAQNEPNGSEGVADAGAAATSPTAAGGRQEAGAAAPAAGNGNPAPARPPSAPIPAASFAPVQDLGSLN